MRETTKQRMRRLQDRAHAWLQRHPRITRAMDYSGCLRADRRAVARGTAAGLFVALTPVFGVQTLLLIAVCVLARANFPVAFATSWISNPFTIGPLVLTFNALGRTLFGPVLQPVLGNAGLAGNALAETRLTLLGSVIVAVPAALLGYAFTLWLQRHMADSEAP